MVNTLLSVRHAIPLLLLLATTSAVAQDSADVAQSGPALKKVMDEIHQLAADPACSRDAECRALPVGHKACGGPADFVVCSLQAGTEVVDKLLVLGAKSQTVARQINAAEDILSDCMLNMPPPLKCVAHRCEITH